VRHFRLALVISLMISSEACHRGAQSSTPSLLANGIAPINACRIAVEGSDVSTWREVLTSDFTLCVPPDWVVNEGDARRGSSEIEWGRGALPDKVIGLSPVFLSPGGAPAPRLPDGDLRRFSEDIGGYRAQLFRNRFGTKYYTGISWEAPAVWLTGEATSLRSADVQIAIYRTVRFIP
jgi:hypothetical protein